VLAGRAHGAAGHPEEAAGLLGAAVREAARRGAHRLRDEAAGELRRLDAAAPAAAGGEANRSALTPREADVARLVAQGGTNREVAAALLLREKTVENHLSRIYAKLGVRSRVELAARAGGITGDPAGR
jgi:DNA-binding NarL/FixJ family response regulator